MPIHEPLSHVVAFGCHHYNILARASIATGDMGESASTRNILAPYEQLLLHQHCLMQLLSLELRLKHLKCWRAAGMVSMSSRQRGFTG